MKHTARERIDPAPARGAADGDPPEDEREDGSEVLALLLAYLRRELTPQERAAADRALGLLETHAPEVEGHGIRVAMKLVEQGAAPEVVTAALLTPVVRGRRLSPKDLAATFGGDSARLLSAIHQAHPLMEQATGGLRRGMQGLLERFAGDIRVLFLVLAERLVDLEEAVRREGLSADRSLSADLDPSVDRSLSADLDPSADRSLSADLDPSVDLDGRSTRARARETLDLYVPLADRLGLMVLRQQLEDVAFRLLDPETYAALLREQGPIREADAACLALLRTDVQQILEHHEIQGSVEARIKSLHGLHVKMLRSGRSIEEVMDKLGMRIIVSSVPDCYAVLGLLHTHYRPIPGTFDDYVGRPKANGYQSLHTCVHPVREISSKPVEFQIRTWQMHQDAQYGAAAHWRYKREQRRHAASVNHRAWLATLPVQHRETASADAFIARLKQQVFEDRLVVFVPDGGQLRVPEGATVRDVLLQCGGGSVGGGAVTVNSRPAGLDTVLEDGDSVAWGESTGASN